jgi:hypothetical protein
LKVVLRVAPLAFERDGHAGRRSRRLLVVSLIDIVVSEPRVDQSLRRRIHDHQRRSGRSRSRPCGRSWRLTFTQYREATELGADVSREGDERVIVRPAVTKPR